MSLTHISEMPRTIHFLPYKDPSPSSVQRKWLSLALQKVQNRHSHHLVDSTVDMFVEHASPVDRERPSALVISLAVAIVGRLASFAATLTGKERSRNGKIYRFISINSRLWKLTRLTIQPDSWRVYHQRYRRMKMSSKS